jgi:hypothetical protein
LAARKAGLADLCDVVAQQQLLVCGLQLQRPQLPLQLLLPAAAGRGAHGKVERQAAAVDQPEGALRELVDVGGVQRQVRRVQRHVQLLALAHQAGEGAPVAGRGAQQLQL